MTEENNKSEEKNIHFEAGIPILSPAPEDENAEKRRDRKAQRTYEDRQLSLQRRILLTQIGLVLFGIAGAGISVWQARTAQQSADTSEKAVFLAQKTDRQSIKAAEDQQRLGGKSLQATINDFHQEQRPWVGVENAEPRDFGRYFGWSIQIGIVFSLRNYGRSPAERVEIYPELEVMTEENRHHPACKRSYPKDDLGYSVLPTEMLRITHVINVRQSEIDNAVKLQKGDRNLFLKVFGCVVYRESSTGRMHHTPFSYALELTNSHYITSDTTQIDDKLMKLEKLTIYAGQAD